MLSQNIKHLLVEIISFCDRTSSKVLGRYFSSHIIR
jgi:hypothetical protein